MKQMRSLKIFNGIAIVLVVWFLTTQLINILISNQTVSLPQPAYGKPILNNICINFNNKPISQIVDDGTYMYILVDSHRGYVQVYDMDGQYRYMISCVRQGINGSFSIASKDGCFYIRDNKYNIYVFQFGRFQEFVEDKDTSEKLGYIPFNEKSKCFELRFGSVWRTDLSMPICVLKRPFYSFVYQYSIDKISLILGVILLTITQNARGHEEGSPS